MQFNEDGYGIKFDKSPIKIKGFLPPDNLLRVISNQNNAIFVNGISLKSDENYIGNIMKAAKKPLFSFGKIFS